jgi:D-glycero-alpha-D-manno-heptose-7-phosphate kinase
MSFSRESPSRITVHAPVRIADIGGWTDTWFAGSGLVCNIAAGPGVTVTVEMDETARRRADGAMLSLADFDQEYALYRSDEPGVDKLRAEHPVLAEILERHLPASSTITRVSIRSSVPAGSSLGTSASVGVALITALRSTTNESLIDTSPLAVAHLAHQAETGAGLQSGVQDHAAAAFGGISEIRVDYPRFGVRSVLASERTQQQLSACLRTVFFGRHDSSSIHKMVIERLESLGDPSECAELVELRSAAAIAITALEADDLRAYGTAMMRTVEAQRGLHEDLISESSQQFVELAKRFSTGAKINGAGGSGGSVTVLAPLDAVQRLRFDSEFELLVASIPAAVVVPLLPVTSGVTVTRS